MISFISEAHVYSKENRSHQQQEQYPHIREIIIRLRDPRLYRSWISRSDIGDRISRTLFGSTSRSGYAVIFR